MTEAQPIGEDTSPADAKKDETGSGNAEADKLVSKVRTGNAEADLAGDQRKQDAGIAPVESGNSQDDVAPQSSLKVEHAAAAARQADDNASVKAEGATLEAGQPADNASASDMNGAQAGAPIVDGSTQADAVEVEAASKAAELPTEKQQPASPGEQIDLPPEQSLQQASTASEPLAPIALDAVALKPLQDEDTVDKKAVRMNDEKE